MNLRFDVSTEFLDAAEKQIFEILSDQRLKFNERWFNNPVANILRPIIRVGGMCLSLLGAILSSVPLLVGQGWSSARIGPEVFLLIFLLFSLFFYFLPSIEQRAKSAIRRSSVRGSKKLAAKSVKAGRSVLPYIAEYDIKGGSVSYYRETQGELKFVWMRKLKGVARQNDFVTIVFRKWASFVPKIVLLHDDSSSVARALQKQSIDCRLHKRRLEGQSHSNSTPV